MNSDSEFIRESWLSSSSGCWRPLDSRNNCRVSGRSLYILQFGCLQSRPTGSNGQSRVRLRSHLQWRSTRLCKEFRRTPGSSYQIFHKACQIPFKAGLLEAIGNLECDCVLICNDAHLVYARNFEELLEALTKFFTRPARFNIKLKPEKTDLCSQFITWSGRRISQDRISYDPQSINGLFELPAPTTAAQLEKLLAATNWMRNSNPVLSRITTCCIISLRHLRWSWNQKKHPHIKKLRLSWANHSQRLRCAGV